MTTEAEVKEAVRKALADVKECEELHRRLGIKLEQLKDYLVSLVRLCNELADNDSSNGVSGSDRHA
ncbi:MAG: hypothetical protein QXZ57_07245 [Nitrososphaerota archaeon]